MFGDLMSDIAMKQAFKLDRRQTDHLGNVFAPIKNIRQWSDNYDLYIGIDVDQEFPVGLKLYLVKR